MNAKDKTLIVDGAAKFRARVARERATRAYRYDDAVTAQDTRLAEASGMTAATISFYRRARSLQWSILCEQYPHALAGTPEPATRTTSPMAEQVYAYAVMTGGGLLAAYAFMVPGPLSFVSVPVAAFLLLAGVVGVRAAERKSNSPSSLKGN